MRWPHSCFRRPGGGLCRPLLPAHWLVSWEGFLRQGALDSCPSPEPQRQQLSRMMQLSCQVTVVTIATLLPGRERKPQHPTCRSGGREATAECCPDHLDGHSLLGRVFSPLLLPGPGLRGRPRLWGGQASMARGRVLGSVPLPSPTSPPVPLPLSLSFPMCPMWW